MVYFISGHRNLSYEDFKKYYIPEIDKIIRYDISPRFIVGDYEGVDKFAMDYIYDNIEYNGEQHYIPKDIFGGKVTFNKQVLRDEYIREYCQNKKIQLIEISYKASIEEIKTIIQSLC